MITTEKVFDERKSVPLIKISDKKFREELLQRVYSAYAWQREANNLLINWVISQNIAYEPLNITGILNNIKSLIEQVSEK